MVRRSLAALAIVASSAAAQRPLPMAGRVVVAVDTAAPARLAASELSAYLARMTGGTFPVVRDAGRRPAIVLRRAAGSASDGDAYAIRVRGDALVLESATPRGLLFAAYDLLERLGCAWLAPDFAFYAGAAEVVPRVASLAYQGPADVVARPRFARRALEVEEGLSHDSASLARMVAWMPKARLTTLVVPVDYGGAGRVRWDAWRSALAPALARRGLTIEVGGHGYQNFLSATDDGGALFAAHPDWFGQDAECRPTRAEQVVFNTASDAAVRHVVDRVVAYLAARPEIDVFDFWPPDGARWAECRALEALGTPADRQARLANAVQAALAARGSRVRLEVIAYANAKEPPTVPLDPRILVDFCPIGQNFDVPIDDARGGNNAQYAALLRRWRAAFGGEIGLYSYYRKYAWLSLPVVLPHYVQHDLRWYASLPLQGITTYAEPADWATYEVNHWTLARLAWDPDADVDALLRGYAAARYGAAAAPSLDALAALEDVVRRDGSVPYSAAPSAARLAASRARLDAADAALRAHSADAAVARLRLMLDYARRDLDVQAARAANDSAGARAAAERVVALHQTHGARGVFLLTGRNDRARILRHYGIRE